MTTIFKDGSERHHVRMDRDTRLLFCYGCSGPIEGLGIKWHGAPNLYLHKACALRMIGGLLQDVHHITQLERDTISRT